MGPWGRFWLDLGWDEAAASRVSAQARGVQRRPHCVGTSRGDLGSQVLWKNATSKSPAMSEMPKRGAAPSRQEDGCLETPP